MIHDISTLKKGDDVHYLPDHFQGDESQAENGVVKRVDLERGNVFVVYNCGGMWHKFEDYTAANTNPHDLHRGWLENAKNRHQ